MEEADDGAKPQSLDPVGVDDMLRELFPDLDLDMVKRVLGLDLNPELDADTEEEQ
jgi:hypothetical protein